MGTKLEKAFDQAVVVSDPVSPLKKVPSTITRHNGK